MGASYTTQKVKINQKVTNDIMQVSNQYCEIASTQDFTGNTLFFIGGTGDVRIEQTSTLSNVNCNMSSVLDSQILNILESMTKQDLNITSGPTYTLGFVEQNVSVYMTTSNAVTQIMSSTCNITSSQSINNNYIYAEDQQGDFYFSQNSEITGATCTMGNAAKSVTENEEIANSDQSATIRNIFGIFLAILALGLVLVIVIVVAMVFSGKKGSKTEASSDLSNTDLLSIYKNANTGAASTAASKNSLSNLITPENLNSAKSLLTSQNINTAANLISAIK